MPVTHIGDILLNGVDKSRLTGQSQTGDRSLGSLVTCCRGQSRHVDLIPPTTKTKCRNEGGTKKCFVPTALKGKTKYNEGKADKATCPHPTSGHVH